MSEFNGYKPESEEEAEFLRSYDPSKFPITTVTVDVVALYKRPDKDWRVLLIQRGNWPYKGYWALPGGFIDETETAREAAARELNEETRWSIPDNWLESLPAATSPNRDPRGRVVALPFLLASETTSAVPHVLPGDDAVKAQWFKLRKALKMPLAFDHEVTLVNAVIKADEDFGMERDDVTMRLDW